MSAPERLEQLPREWRVKRLSSLTNSYAGGTPNRSKPEYFDGDIPWVKSGEINLRKITQTEERISEIALSESAARMVESGSVLVAMYGATAGKVARLKIDAAINQAVLSIRTVGDELDNDFLFWVIENSAEKLLSMCQGAAQPNLSKGLIDGLEIATPPLLEQQKIAAILTAVDDKLGVITRQIEATQALKQGMMQKLFSRGVGIQEATGRWMPHTKFKESQLGEIPEGWLITTLGGICNGALQTGPFGSQLHAAEYEDEGVPVLMPKDLLKCRANLSTAARIAPVRAEELAKHKLFAGDLLFSRRGDVARFALIDERSAGALCGTGCLKAKPSEGYSSAYIAHLLQLDVVRAWLEQNAVGQTMPNMNTGILSSLPLVAPANKQEQEEIAGILDSVDAKKGLLFSKKMHFQTLKRGLMQKLLTGEWRVS